MQAVLAVRGLVAMLPDVPGEDANLVEVERQAVMRFGQKAEVFGEPSSRRPELRCSAKKATNRWPSAYCAMSRGTSTSTMRASTHPTRPCSSRTSHQSSSTGPVGFGA